jgi:hypothetical protein
VIPAIWLKVAADAPKPIVITVTTKLDIAALAKIVAESPMFERKQHGGGK